MRRKLWTTIAQMFAAATSEWGGWWQRWRVQRRGRPGAGDCRWRPWVRGMRRGAEPRQGHQARCHHVRGHREEQHQSLHPLAVAGHSESTRTCGPSRAQRRRRGRTSRLAASSPCPLRRPLHRVRRPQHHGAPPLRRRQARGQRRHAARRRRRWSGRGARAADVPWRRYVSRPMVVRHFPRWAWQPRFETNGARPVGAPPPPRVERHGRCPSACGDGGATPAHQGAVPW